MTHDMKGGGRSSEAERRREFVWKEGRGEGKWPEKVMPRRFNYKASQA
jgi:hypothetical protein